MPVGPPLKGFSRSGEGDILVVCDDASGGSVGRFHGMGRATRGIGGPLWILKVAISMKVSIVDAAILSRASWARLLGCLWPAVVECPLGLRPRFSMRIPP